MQHVHWIFGLLTAALVGDALRLRGKTRALPVVAPSDEPVSPDHVFLVAPGYELDEPTRRALSAHARNEHLDVLDIVPGSSRVADALLFLQVFNPAGIRDRLAFGRTAGVGMVVTRDVVERSGVALDPPDAAELVHLALRLKPYACTTMAHAVVPALRARRVEPRTYRAQFFATFSNAAPVALAIQGLVLAVLVGGPILSRPWGAAALIAFQLQPALALAGTRIGPQDLGLSVLFWPVLFAVRWMRTAFGGRAPAPPPDRVDALRAVYAELLAGGLERFFEPRAEQCPLCEGRDLVEHLVCDDQAQYKPGSFVLDRCRGCGHIFQNPRLSLEGLAFYYRDFYDGLGADQVEVLFGKMGYGATPYLERARLIASLAKPARWLDVGAGHGHFCCLARDVLPETRFHALDMNDAIEEAVRRRWVDEAHRGLFPELAATLRSQFDVVSMTHYLEHVIDQRADLRAAYEVLRPDGLVFIEIPDPECPWSTWLGRLWIPYLQPQHLHFLSMKNLDGLLRAQGFEPIVWQRGQAHMPVDLAFAVYRVLGLISRPPDLPWRPAASRAAKLAHRVVWSLGVAPLVLAYGLDLVVRRWVAPKLDASNTFRVVARKAA
jgi:SAM-dependent methyltransferase